MEQKNAKLKKNSSNTQEMIQIALKKIKHLNALNSKMPLLAFASENLFLKIQLNSRMNAQQEELKDAK